MGSSWLVQEIVVTDTGSDHSVTARVLTRCPDVTAYTVATAKPTDVIKDSTAFPSASLIHGDCHVVAGHETLNGFELRFDLIDLDYVLAPAAWDERGEELEVTAAPTDRNGSRR